MRFTKAHGTGNDFVVVVDLDDSIDLDDDLVRALCDRRLGVGADGVLRLVGRDDADVFMDHRNADGSRPEMCGNGVRVVAKHVVDHGYVAAADGVVHVATRAGVKDVTIERDGAGRVVRATVDMGPPRLEPADIPFDASGERAVNVPVDVSGTTVELTALSMGNPHAVLVVDDVDDAPVHDLGAALEVHERFPKRTNVEFVAVTGEATADVRVWERGVGETAACGTGACAAFVALQQLDLAGDEITLTFPGGDVVVRHVPEEHPSVFLTGPAVEVASGELDRVWLQTHRGSRG